MAKVAFRTKSGKKISFTAKKKSGGKRKMTAYQRHVAKELRKASLKGKSPAQIRAAMRAAAKSWKG